MVKPIIILTFHLTNRALFSGVKRIRSTNKNGYFTKGSAQLCSQRKHLASFMGTRSVLEKYLKTSRKEPH
jgi:hypothetical protein